LERNYNSTENWLFSLGTPDKGQKKGGYTWQAVKVEKMLSFLKSYTTDKGAFRADTNLLAKYISAQQSQDELKEWTVHLVSSGDSSALPHEIAGHKVGLIQRAPFPDSKEGDARYTIRRLVSPADEWVDFTSEQWVAALNKAVEKWQSEETKKTKKPKYPSGYEARVQRSVKQGLLLIYPLDSNKAKIGGTDKPVVGIAISFPKSDTAIPISYIVNNRYIQGADDDDGF
jgi:hypothetical protein